MADFKDTTLSVEVRRALPRFSLEVAFRAPASRITLFGASGAGKSLTLQAIAGLFPLDRARISRGETLWHESATGLFVPPQERRIGYLPQNYALFPHLTVAQNVAFGQQQRGNEAKQRVTELISLMRLDGLERLRPGQLSGGQQQRVALARALAREPQLLLLDEPWSALDAPVHAALREELQRFYEQFQVPLVLVTHDPLDAQMLSDTVVVIHHGHVLQIGSPEDVFRSPRTPQVAELVGMREHWTGRIISIEPFSAHQQLAHIQVADLTLQAVVPLTRKVQPGQSIEIGLHTDEIIICETETKPDITRPDVLLPGRIIQDQARGMVHIVTVYLTPEMQLEIPVPRWQHRTLHIAAGQAVTLAFPREAVHLFETDEPAIAREEGA
ncbi:MAG TPA: ABC transporter ATP-binding protein [Ktedonobacteraceae bacterium]|nr:ABC transporter ATP-binding protein [Ktedonobacteraceae bacterium]